MTIRDVLKLLDEYVRQPLAGTVLDVWLFSPAREAYLRGEAAMAAEMASENELRHRLLRKYD